METIICYNCQNKIVATYRDIRYKISGIKFTLINSIVCNHCKKVLSYNNVETKEILEAEAIKRQSLSDLRVQFRISIIKPKSNRVKTTIKKFYFLYRDIIEASYLNLIHDTRQKINSLLIEKRMMGSITKEL